MGGREESDRIPDHAPTEGNHHRLAVQAPSCASRPEPLERGDVLGCLAAGKEFHPNAARPEGARHDSPQGSEATVNHHEKARGGRDPAEAAEPSRGKQPLSDKDLVGARPQTDRNRDSRHRPKKSPPGLAQQGGKQDAFVRLARKE